VQSRNSRGQRVPLASVEKANISDRGGVPYYVYEAAQQVLACRGHALRSCAASLAVTSSISQGGRLCCAAS
jgi:hypothetical protein